MQESSRNSVRSHVSNPKLLSELMQFVDAWNAAPASAQFAGQAEYYMQGIIQVYTNAPAFGASGAVFGILLAFGMLFPNTELYLMFIRSLLKRSISCSCTVLPNCSSVYRIR